MTTKTSLRVAAVLSAAGLAVATAPLVADAVPGMGRSSAAKPANHAQATAKAQANYGRLPISFVANAGQHDPAVRFSAQAGKSTLFVTPTEAVLSLPGAEDTKPHALRLGLVGANPDPEVVGEKPLPGKVNYLTGNDPKAWKTNLATYAKVTSRSVYPGIDLTWYGKGQALEYDFVVAPGADPSRIAMSVSGATELRLDKAELVMDTPAGEVRQHAPVIYQTIDGKRRSVDGRFVLRDDHTVGFLVGDYEARLPLVIDPVLAYSTYLGGSGVDMAYGVAVDAHGAAYVAGNTVSSDFPIPPGTTPFQAAWTGVERDAFVAKLDPNGSRLVYATYLGGTERDEPWGIAVDAAGAASVVGTTGSKDFPTTPGAFDRTKGGVLNQADTFVATLAPDGSALGYASYLGGTFSENGSENAGIALGPSGRIYLAGSTASADFPTTAGAFDRLRSGQIDAYLAVVDSSVQGDGSGLVTSTNPGLIYATYLGGSEDENHELRAGGLAVDGSGLAYLTGRTASSDFPVTAGAFDTTFGGEGECGVSCNEHDAFLAVIDPSRTGDGSGMADPVKNPALRYSTYLGGKTGAGGSDRGDLATAVAVRNGIAYVAGNTGNTDFPVTPGAFQTRHGGCATPGCDGFVAVVDTTKSGDGSGVASPANPALVYSTFLGTAGTADEIYAIGVDRVGQVWVAGATLSTTFPLRKPLQSLCGCRYASLRPDAFVARLRPNPTDGDASRPSSDTDLINDPTDLSFSTYLGGTGSDAARALALDGRDNVYVSGVTASPEAITLSDGTVVSEPFPTTHGSAQPANANAPRGDAFVSRISFGAPSLAVSGSAVREGNSATTDLTFTVSLSGYSASTVTVNYATADATAIAPKDYTPTSGTLVFAPGEQTKTVAVKVNGDTKLEPDEKLALKLSAATGATLTVAKAPGRILNDD